MTAGDGDLPVSPPVLPQVLRPGHDVLIDDGRVRLRVDGVEGGRVASTVVIGGVVEAHKGVNVPGVPIPVPSLTEKDRRDLDFALGLGVDYVALSFVRSANDVRELRELLHAAGSEALVIAKIEKAEALDDLNGILEVSDAVMVARGDLGVEIGPAEVPLVQKRILQAALEHGKPAITATQMLESMLHQPEPTRAEASDVANAILDGTSALMLSGETAVGRFPIESVQTMDKIARAVEPSLGYRHELAQGGQPFPIGGGGHVERRLRHRRGARSSGDPRPDLQRADRSGGRAPPAPAAGHRRHAQATRRAAARDRVGRRARPDRAVPRCRAPLGGEPGSGPR